MDIYFNKKKPADLTWLDPDFILTLLDLILTPPNRILTWPYFIPDCIELGWALLNQKKTSFWLDPDLIGLDLNLTWADPDLASIDPDFTCIGHDWALFCMNFNYLLQCSMNFYYFIWTCSTLYEFMLTFTTFHVIK